MRPRECSSSSHEGPTAQAFDSGTAPAAREWGKARKRSPHLWVTSTPWPFRSARRTLGIDERASRRPSRAARTEGAWPPETAAPLPFLEAMLPPFALHAKAAGKPVHRFQAFYVPNGMAMEYWSPKGEGSAFELSPILEPLAPYRNQMLVLSGLRASWNYIHAGASGSFLTGTTHGGRNEVEIVADVSMDQILARHFGSETQVASLELSMDLPANAGACTGNLSCAYTHTLSW